MREINEIHAKMNFNVAIVVSRFNIRVTNKLYEGALDRLRQLKFSEDQINIVFVPGAVEIPVTAQRLAKTKQFKAIICLGSVIRGETSHFDYVCEQVSSGCARVALDYNIPVIYQVLMTRTAEQALARAGGAQGHKGIEAVDCACEMVAVMQSIDEVMV